MGNAEIQKLRKLDDFGTRFMVMLSGNQDGGDPWKFPLMDKESVIPFSVVKEMMFSIKEVDSLLGKLEVGFYQVGPLVEEIKVNPNLSNEKPAGGGNKEMGLGEIERVVGYNEKEKNGLEVISSDGQ